MENVNASQSSLNFELKKRDPEYLLQFLNKYVKVYLVKNITFNGFIKTIDPITHSVILMVPKEEKFQITLLPGHAVTNIVTLPAPPTASPPTDILISENDEEIEARKTKLIAWFTKNLLPVSTEGNIIVVGTAKLLPPYSIMDIYAETPVVAERIRKIMTLLPEYFVA